MADLLFGLETEYALAAFDESGERVAQEIALNRLIRLAERRLTYLRGFGGSDLFLPFGRLYLDSGGHPEFCTPECDNPRDLVRYCLAGDRLMSNLAEEMTNQSGIADVVVSRCNVDYGGRKATWGCHESYLYRRRRWVVPEQLIPHLVSRIVYTGAGGFDTKAPGRAFMVSPRASHLTTVVGDNSTHHRPIYHTKNEPLAEGGSRRLHLICGESLCSETAAWLKVAATALVVAMIDAGRKPGDGVQLVQPLEAIRAFARDPECRAVAEVEGGRRLSALAIQYHYLERAEAEAGAGFMPSWAPEACKRWREALELAARGPEAAAGVFDWAIKLNLFKRFAEREGVDLKDLEAPKRQHHELCWKLSEIDLRFSRPGLRGIFGTLSAEGRLAHGIRGIRDTGLPLDAPPERGRAKARADRILELAKAERPVICDWTTIIDYGKKTVCDLTDPFSSTSEWIPFDPKKVNKGELDRLNPRARRIMERLEYSGMLDGFYPDEVINEDLMDRVRRVRERRRLRRASGSGAQAGAGDPSP
jgi:proteasome accessory factor A